MVTTRGMLREAEVVGDDDDRRPALLVDGEEEVVNRAAGRGVEVARGLVGEQELRREHERPRERDALLLAARELARPVQHALARAPPRRAARAPGSPSRAAALPWMRPGIITFSSALNSGSRWWNWKTNPIVRFRRSARRAPEQRRQLFAGEADRARRREVERADAVQERATCPRPTGPDDREHLALVDGDVDAPEHVERAPHVAGTTCERRGRRERAYGGLASYS